TILDRHAVFGFWFETPTTGMTAAHTALPITQANATGIYFVARRKQSAIGESIYGSVDRITGAVSAMENKLYPSGNLQTTEWDLHCEPARHYFRSATPWLMRSDTMARPHEAAMVR